MALRGLSVAVPLLAAALALGGCAPRSVPAGPAVTEPMLAAAAEPSELVVADGTRLPLRAWSAGAAPKAVILALHGFNDYSNAFEDAGKYWAARGVATYAYDQRGFGRAPGRGYWAGMETYESDLRDAVRALRRRHAQAPLYVLGESMGGAIVMRAAARGVPELQPSDVAGLILVAPAVWSRGHMPFYQAGVLWLAAHTMPWLRLTGEGLNIRPSDNIAMLRRLSADPLVIKETRIDAIWGLADLMDAAFDAAPQLTRTPALVLYGVRDEVVPDNPTVEMMARLPAGVGHRAAIYARGYHMLLRDLQAETVMADVAAWIADPALGLPSGADQAGRPGMNGTYGR